MQAWYFAAEDRKLRYDDGRLVEKGVTHEVDCTPVLCEQGLHASKRVLDALSYSPGPILCRVELGGAFALAMMRADLDKAARALAEGDVPAMIAAYQALKEYEL